MGPSNRCPCRVSPSSVWCFDSLIVVVVPLFVMGSVPSDAGTSTPLPSSFFAGTVGSAVPVAILFPGPSNESVVFVETGDAAIESVLSCLDLSFFFFFFRFFLLCVDCSSSNSESFRLIVSLVLWVSSVLLFVVVVVVVVDT